MKGCWAVYCIPALKGEAFRRKNVTGLHEVLEQRRKVGVVDIAGLWIR
ncbi:hypothetical protein [Thermococcus stetteri]|nr:hypothetical protein [Thermococcus stetteri]MBP1911868.1 hypothetical protein [Thermococcus stetteri]